MDLINTKDAARLRPALKSLAWLAVGGPLHILAHETGHWLAARAAGIPLKAFKVSFWHGGVTPDYERAPDDPWRWALVAAAGPAANIAIAAALLWAGTWSCALIAVGALCAGAMALIPADGSDGAMLLGILRDRVAPHRFVVDVSDLQPARNPQSCQRAINTVRALGSGQWIVDAAYCLDAAQAIPSGSHEHSAEWGVAWPSWIERGDEGAAP